ncbi:CPD family protein [Megaselia abdita]
MWSRYRLALFVILSTWFLAGQTFILREDESFLENPFYHSQEDIEELFDKLSKHFPQNARVVHIGRSVENRNLIALHISKNVQTRNILTPMVKYIGNMHGDETIGRQLLIYLAQYLLFNYDKNIDVASLVNSTDLYVMPTMNPDGFFRSQEGKCDSLPGYVGRINANGVDLNRDFPDRLEDEKTVLLKSRSRQPETAAMIHWIKSEPFVLSANFHGGAVVASYPYDNSIYHRECCVESKSPDDRFFKLMAHTYSENHPVMRNGKDCNETFTNGVTNGAFWYELNGGMQDFNYAFSNCFELTIELSCCKFPLANTLPDEWRKNKKSLLELIELAQIGVKGLVRDTNGYPIVDAQIIVENIEDKTIRTTTRGEYWRLLDKGTYTIYASAFGYHSSKPQVVEITDNRAPVIINFNLKPEDSNDGKANYQHLVVERDSVGTNGTIDFLIKPKFVHHSTLEIEEFAKRIARDFPSITRLYSAGKSVNGNDLWVLEITKNPGKHTFGVPEFKYVANMHGNEVVGREMLVLLTKLIVENYMLNDRITKLVNTTRMHFMYSLNPDGYDISTEGDRTGGVGRPNIHNIDLNRNFPDQYGTNKYNLIHEPEVLALMNWTLSIPFVLSANLHGGALVANYPFDDSTNDFDPNYIGPKTKYNPTEDNDIFSYLAKTFADEHREMHKGVVCDLFPKEKFENGITNGAKWYSVTGGMQDWNYWKAGVFELTLELSCDKFPMAKNLPDYWDQNKYALIKFIEQVHHSIFGYISSSIGHPIVGAIVLLDGKKHGSYSFENGEYWKLVLPGKHNLTVIADGFEAFNQEIVVPPFEQSAVPMRMDITMMRDDPQHWSSAHDFRVLDNVVNTKYHSTGDLNKRMSELENRYPDIAEFEFGGNEIDIEYHKIKMTRNLGAPEETKFHILIMSSFFGGSNAIGKEMTLNLARYIAQGYPQKEPPILKLLDNAVFHFLPIINNFDEDIVNQYLSNTSFCDPKKSEDLADKILSPEFDRKKDLFMQFMKKEQFDLVLSFSSGGNDMHYPPQSSNDRYPIFSELAQYVMKTEYNLPPQKCPQTVLRNNQMEIVQSLTNMFSKLYKIPLFTFDISCCGMPPQSDLATIWRRNHEIIKNFIHLIDTGVKGLVKDFETNEPLRSATVLIYGNERVYNVSKNLAQFKLILPKGSFDLVISSSGYSNKRFTVIVEQGVVKDLGSIGLEKFVPGKSDVVEMTFDKPKSSSGAISGYVMDTSNHPLENARIYLIVPKDKGDIETKADKIGFYKLERLPNQDVTIMVDSAGHESEARLVHIGTLGHTVNGVIFRLAKQEQVMGMPRLLFIILTGLILLVFVACCTFCIHFIKTRKELKVENHRRNYSFSLLPQKGKVKELFADDEDDDETDLFTSPIRSKFFLFLYD